MTRSRVWECRWVGNKTCWVKYAWSRSDKNCMALESVRSSTWMKKLRNQSSHPYKLIQYDTNNIHLKLKFTLLKKHRTSLACPTKSLSLCKISAVPLSRLVITWPRWALIDWLTAVQHIKAISAKKCCYTWKVIGAIQTY